MDLANWNRRVPLHEKGYELDAFRRDPAHLSHNVQFDVPRLGDVRGLSAVHLQCHLGTDTLPLSRLGANVVGLDFPPPLEVARFDLVYTGIGALGWLPSIEGWANVVSALLAPGERLFIREGQPVAWALCEPREDGLQVLEFPYFETPDGVEFVERNTYVEHEGEAASPRFIALKHGMAEIMAALMRAGLMRTAFEEHASVPWDPFGEPGVCDEVGEWRLRESPLRLPATYTLQAVKGRS